MDVLVIGGTGFISGRLTDLLLERGHDVAIVTRGRSTRSFDRPVERLRADRRDARALAAAVGRRTFDVVVDMIAYDADDVRAALEALRERTERWVHCSTVSVYMISDEPTCPITEDQDRLPVMDFWPRNPFGMQYGLDKRACEAVLREERGLDVTILRPTYVSGPEDPTARDYFWIQRILDGRPILVPGSGDHAFQQVYVDDAARAFADAIERSPAGWAYNVVGEDIYSLNEYLRRMAALLERRLDLVHVDQASFDELTLSVHSRGDVFPFNTRRTAVFSLDRTKRDLAYQSTRYETWMARTIEWYLARGGHSLGYDRRDNEVAVAERLRSAAGPLPG